MTDRTRRHAVSQSEKTCYIKKPDLENKKTLSPVLDLADNLFDMFGLTCVVDLMGLIANRSRLPRGRDWTSELLAEALPRGVKRGNEPAHEAARGPASIE